MLVPLLQSKDTVIREHRGIHKGSVRTSIDIFLKLDDCAVAIIRLKRGRQVVKKEFTSAYKSIPELEYCQETSGTDMPVLLKKERQSRQVWKEALGHHFVKNVACGCNS